MASVRVVCDANFKKSEDVDKSVKKVLKMFSKHFVEKMAPLNEDSDMECVYVYDDLTPEQVRILKKLLNQNKTLLNFKEVIVSNTKKKALETQNPADSDSDHGSVSSKSSSSSQSSKSSYLTASSLAKSASSSSSAHESSSSTMSSKRSSKRVKRCKRKTKDASKYSQIAQKLRELADEIDNC